MGLLDIFKKKPGTPATAKRSLAPGQLFAGAVVRPLTQAAQSGRLEATWESFPTTPDAQIYQEWRAVVARSRRAFEDYDHFRKFVQLVRDNVAGPRGFHLNAKIRDPIGTIDTLASQAIESAYAQFSKRGNFDASGMLSRTEAERLAIQSWATDGEVLVLIKRGPQYPHGIAFQFIDAVRLDPIHYRQLPNGNHIRHGIEMNDDGRPIAYWINSYEELQVGYIYSYTGQNYTRIDARDIIHWFVPEKVGQKRGLAPGRTALWRMRMLSGFEDAAVTNARMGASKMGFFKDADGDNEDGENLPIDAEPGVFENIGNREFVPFTPQFPDQAIEPFIKAIVRSLGASLNVSYHNLANDLTSVNFSSIRQGALDEREVWKGLQESFKNGIVIPMFEAWLEIALLKQIITVPSKTGDKPLKFDRIDKYRAVEFTGRRWAWIDPAAEQSANEKAVAQGFKSRSEVIRETSTRDPEDVWDEIQAENIELEKRKIVPLIPSGSVPPMDAQADSQSVAKQETTSK